MLIHAFATAIALFLFSIACPSAQAFPAYAEWISKKSGTQVDCAYCHKSIFGPTGNGPGQTGSLSAAESKLLHTANSPILNDFGKQIMAKYGYDKVLSEMSTPEKLAQEMTRYDLDGDGVNDGAEMEYGTLADDSLSAPPSLIWWINLQRHALFVSVIAISAICAAAGLFTLNVGGTDNRAPEEKHPGDDSHDTE
jgi:hypothetical protein